MSYAVGCGRERRPSRNISLSDLPTPMRWDPYILAHGAEFAGFWTDHLSSRNRDLLIIVGRGFDVRACDACHSILGAGGRGRRDAWLLCFDNGLEDSDHRKALTAKNEAAYRKLFEKSAIRELEILLGNTSRPTATSRNTVRAFSGCATLGEYDDIVLDVSAMPRMVALTAIAKLLAMLDGSPEARGANLHVVVSESVASDRRATFGSLSDVVTTVVGFSGRKNAESDDFMPRVWFPVLGEDQEARLSRIRDDLMPNEICPVIPFPSRDPRRGDHIIASYRQLLFDEFQIEPNNILHACEFNPLRRISRSSARLLATAMR